VPTHVQLQRDFAPPKGGERPAALTRNGSGLGASDLGNCAALPVHWLVAVLDAQDLFVHAKHLFVAAIGSGPKLLCAGQSFAPYCGDTHRTATHRTMFIIPHGAPEGYEWFVALVVLVGLYFAVRSFMRARKRRLRLTPGEVQRLEQRSHTRL